MTRRLEDHPDVYRLGDRVGGFLQVLLPKMVLSRESGGLTVNIEIQDDLPCITGNAGKRALQQVMARDGGKARSKVGARLRRFLRDEDMLSYRLDALEAPFRHANGGVLPIVRYDGEDHYCLFYRDIFPRGWNIANGASDTERELLRPGTIVLREFSEELFIADVDKKQLFRFDPEDIPDAGRAFEKSLEAWSRKKKGLNLKDYEVGPIPLKWIDGPDRVRVRMGDDWQTTDGCFVSITPEDNAIELDRIARINLKGEIGLFDGELHNDIPINRVVGLFEVKRLRRTLSRTDFKPDIVFIDGCRREVEELEGMIVDEYLKGPAFRARRYERRRRYLEETGPRYDLCPITREILRRHSRWATEDRKRAALLSRGREKKRRSAPGGTKVFISFRSYDVEVGRMLYRELDDRGIEAFFSAESLVHLGESDYAKAIDRALEQADCVVVIGTRAESFDSGWVGYEWRSFLNEIRSGRKPGGQLFTFSLGVATDDMPYALRSRQNVPFNPASPLDSLDGICHLVEAALGLRNPDSDTPT